VQVGGATFSEPGLTKDEEEEDEEEDQNKESSHKIIGGIT
jgi:hypothetical protein